MGDLFFHVFVNRLEFELQEAIIVVFSRAVGRGD